MLRLHRDLATELSNLCPRSISSPLQEAFIHRHSPAARCLRRILADSRAAAVLAGTAADIGKFKPARQMALINPD
jgi:hypothetical protein